MGASAGDYAVTGLIARGGCGSVYRARHLTIDQSAAIKVLHAPLSVMPKMVERFRREVGVVGMLRHPNIVEIYAVGTLPDHRPYYVMEYLSGRTLSAILAEEGRMSPLEALEVLEPVCAALAAAHAAGVVHRDVKASNIMVGPEGGAAPRPGRVEAYATGSVKLLDFGIAKLLDPKNGPIGLTSEGRQVGTLTIMAPEQLLGGPVDARIDIYALGVLIYRMLTGRLPFDGKNALTLAQQHLEEPAPRPSLRIPISASLDAVVLRCLEKRPERRYDTVEDLLEALRRATLGVRRRESGETTFALGVGIYLDVRVRADGDEYEAALEADALGIVELAEEALCDRGFVLAVATGSNVLGVRILPAEPEACLAARADAIEVASSLHEHVAQREGRDPRVHVNVCVHVDALAFRSGDSPHVTGGALVRTDAWAPRADVSALCATRAAVEGLTGYELVEGAAGEGTLVAVAGRTTAP